MELFSAWFFNHFLKYVPKYRPILLLLDGHASHYCPKVIRMAAKEKVIIFTLPPNTTHLTQPLDRACFSPLKVNWRHVVQDFVARNHRPVTRYDFSSLFAEAWGNAMTMKNIMSGFKVCGICPYSREAQIKPEATTSFRPEELPLLSGLKFIPMYSPARNESIYVRVNTSTPCQKERTASEYDPCSPSNSLLRSTLGRQYSFSESNLHDLSLEDQFAAESNKCVIPLPQSSRLRQYLITPKPPSTAIRNRSKSCGRSSKNMKDIEEREEKKRLLLME